MNDFQERLQELLDENNLNRVQLAQLIGISNTTINSYFNLGFYPEIKIAIKISNHFSCSLDYLLGLSENKVNHYENKNSFFQNFDKLLKLHNKTITMCMLELKMSKNNYSRWKNGYYPKTITLIEIAKYFDTSVDYLVGNMKYLSK